ncbi:MAG: hypothetical protein WAU52_12020 [Burkholderiales bacterium]
MTAARADGGPSLEQQVKALSEQVHQLQLRLDRLEGRTQSLAPATEPAPAAPAAITAAAPGAGYVSPEAALRNTWARIKPDMAESEVASLLGAPSKKFTLDGRRGWYYYYPGSGAGSVFFTDQGRVSSRQSPFGMGW